MLLQNIAASVEGDATGPSARLLPLLISPVHCHLCLLSPLFPSRFHTVRLEIVSEIGIQIVCSSHLHLVSSRRLTIRIRMTFEKAFASRNSVLC